MPTQIQQDIAKSIRRERLRQGLNQTQLAQRMETTQQYVSELESGERSPSVVTLERVASALNVQISSLLPEES